MAITMRVTVSSVITVENPTDAAQLWCQKNLTLANPEYAKKSRMHLWLGDTPARLSLYEQRGDTLILPFGVLRRLPDFIDADTVCAGAFAKPVEVNYGASMVPLYPYQKEAVDCVLGCKFGILQSPAGSGKTQMGIALVKKFGARALWLTHIADLLQQSKARAEQYMSKAITGTITEGKVNIGKGITFATIQTMCKLDLAQYRDYWDVVIVDECHRVAGGPTAVTQFYKVLNSLSARHKIGLSATVHRSDGLIAATQALLGEVVHTVPRDAVADRIMTVGITPVGTGVEIGRECLNTDGTLNYTKLIGHLCDCQERNDLITEYIVNDPRPSLILSDRLGHLEKLMARFPPNMREQAVMISGKMSAKKDKAKREAAIENMRTGKKQYLFATYALAKEGLDIPCLERLFMTTPQKDYAVVTQSIGRIARAHEGKAEPVAYDFVDDIEYAVRAYKKRCAVYRKNGCYFVGEVSK